MRNSSRRLGLSRGARPPEFASAADCARVKDMSRWVATAFLLFATAFGCAMEGDLPGSDEVASEDEQRASFAAVPPDQIRTFPYESVPAWSPEATGRLPPDPAEPCTCETHECFQEWAEASLPCDVCVVLLCGEETPHACHFC